MIDKERVVIYPLSGFDVRLAPEHMLVVAVDVIPHAVALKTGERHTVPIGMNAEQARELAKVLMQAADAAEAAQTGSPSIAGDD